MKRFIYIFCSVLFSFFVGSLFMDISSESEVIPVMGNNNNAKVIEAGSYTTSEEALKEASLKRGIVLKENNTFKVYLAVLRNNTNIERMLKYLDKRNYYYYVKDVYIPSEFLSTLTKYEDLMLSSTSDVAFSQLNKKILEGYESLYESQRVTDELPTS